jgi:hypothetical protein
MLTLFQLLLISSFSVSAASIFNAAQIDCILGHSHRNGISSLVSVMAEQADKGKSIVAMPSMSLDPETLSAIKGVGQYETRSLFKALQASGEKDQIIFVTSLPINETLLREFRQLHPNGEELLKRVKFLSLDDDRSIPLAEKILEPIHKDKLEQLQGYIKDKENQTYLSPFISTELEENVAKRLGIPVLGPKPDHAKYGHKSLGREMMRKAGIHISAGVENLKNRDEAIDAILTRWEANNDLRKVVVKVNDGVSGEGNATLKLPTYSKVKDHRKEIDRLLKTDLKFENQTLTDEKFFAEFKRKEGIVEEWIEGEEKLSPSVQVRIHPSGEVEVLSTHEQILNGQVYQGAIFPADKAYRAKLNQYGRSIGEKMRDEGVIGDFAVDFIATPSKSKDAVGGYDLFGIEINLREGGTTHPREVTKVMTGAVYDEQAGLLRAGNNKVYYTSSDNVFFPELKGVDPDEFIAFLREKNLLYDSETMTGIVPQLLGILPIEGKFGFVAIAKHPRTAKKIYEQVFAAAKEFAQSR